MSYVLTIKAPDIKRLTSALSEIRHAIDCGYLNGWTNPFGITWHLTQEE